MLFEESIELSAPAKRGQNPLDVIYEHHGLHSRTPVAFRSFRAATVEGPGVEGVCRMGLFSQGLSICLFLVVH